MENRYKIALDFKQRCFANVVFVQNDIDSSVLEFTMLNYGMTLDLTGQTISLAFLKPDNTVVIQDMNNGVSILDAPNGKFQCILKSNTLAAVGTVKTEISFSDATGKKLSSAPFTFTVSASLDNGDGVISTSEIPKLDSKINDIETRYGSDKATWDAEVNVEIAQTETARQDAITATTNANTATNNANTAVANANDAVTNINNNTLTIPKGIKATYASLPASGNTIGDSWQVNADTDTSKNGHWRWNGTTWIQWYQFNPSGMVNTASLNDVDKAKADLVRNQMHSGVEQLTPITTGITSTLNAFSIKAFKALINGYEVSVPDTTIVLDAPPTTGARDDLVFLEAWFPQNGNGYTLGWRIRTVSNVNFNTYPQGFRTSGSSWATDTTQGVSVAQGGNASPLYNASGSKYHYVFTQTGETFQPSSTVGDQGLFIAGDGSSSDKSLLATYDGYSYAIPLFRVKRRNSSGFSPSNMGGARGYVTIGQLAVSSSLQPYMQGTVTVPATNYSQIQVGDILRNTSISSLDYAVKVISINGSNQLTVQCLGTQTISAGTTGSLYYIQSDHPQSLYSNVIDARDIPQPYDLRHRVQAQFNYEYELKRGFDQFMRSEIGTQKKMLTVHHGIPKSEIDGNTVFYADLDGNTRDQISGQTLSLGTGSYKPMPTGSGYKFNGDSGTPVVVSGLSVNGGTVDLVFNANDLTASGRTLVSLEDNNGYKVFGIYYGTNSIQLYFYSDTAATVQLPLPALDTTNLKGYHHLRATWKNGVGSKIYLDGVLKTTSAITMMLTPAKVYLGGMKSNGSNTVNGFQSVYGVSDIHISNIDRGALFPQLPADFISGDAIIMPATTNQRKIFSEAQMSQTVNGIISVNNGGAVADILTDFQGKVAGSTTVNPNIHYSTQNGSLRLPTDPKTTDYTTGWTEVGTSGYSQLAVLDGTIKSVTSTAGGSGLIAQQLFSFDLIRTVEDKYGTIPGSTTIDKVTWLKNNISKITCNWWGYGSSPTGNNATVKGWDTSGNTWSASSVSNPNPTVTKLTYGVTSNIGNKIDSNGFFSVIAYADPSDGTTASLINTDYIQLDLTLAPQKSLRTNSFSGSWLNGNTVTVTGMAGELISGVIDADTALATVVKDYTATDTVYYLDDVSKLSVGDTVRLMDRISAANLSANTATITAIDTTVKSITVNTAFSWANGKYNTLVVETTATSSSPTVNFMNGATKTAIAGSWSGLGTNQATVTLSLDGAVTNEASGSVAASGTYTVASEAHLGGAYKYKNVTVNKSTDNVTFTAAVSGTDYNFDTTLGKITNPTAGALYYQISYTPYLDQDLQIDYSLIMPAGQPALTAPTTTTLMGEAGIRVPASMATITSDFSSKIAGQTWTNPNIHKRVAKSVLAPPSDGGWAEVAQTNVNQIMTLDGTVHSLSNPTNGYQSQHLFSFDLIKIIERKLGCKIPAKDTVGKVAWLKANLINSRISWTGFGSSPNGNKAYLTLWGGSNWAAGAFTNTSSSPSTISQYATNWYSTWLTSCIQPDGFIHFLAYADPSDGTTPSIINTDYVSLDITFANKIVNSYRLVTGSTVHVRDDFAGKVSGSVVENPNEIKVSTVDNLSLISPPSFNYTQQSYFDGAKSLDNALTYNAKTVNGAIPQMLFSFNLITMVESKYGTIPAIDKVQWLKDNLSNVTCNWWGYGSSPTGNKGTLSIWSPVGLNWVTKYQNTNGAVTKSSTGALTDMGYVDSNGFVYFLAYADPSDGVTASTIYTDYVNIELQFKTLTGYDILSPDNPRRDAGMSSILYVRKETKEVQPMLGHDIPRNLVSYSDYFPTSDVLSANTNVTILAEIPEFLVTDLGSSVGQKQGVHQWMNPAYRVGQDNDNLYGELGFSSVPLAPDSVGVNIGAWVGLASPYGLNSGYTAQYSLPTIQKPISYAYRYLVLTANNELQILLITRTGSFSFLQSGGTSLLTAFLIPIQGKPLSREQQGVPSRTTFSSGAWKTNPLVVEGYVDKATGKLITTNNSI